MSLLCCRRDESMREQLLELIWAAVTEEQREQSLLLGAEGIIEMVREEYDDGI